MITIGSGLPSMSSQPRKHTTITWGWRLLVACVLVASSPAYAVAQLDVPNLVQSFRYQALMTWPESHTRRLLEQQIAETDSATAAAAVPALIATLEDEEDASVRTGSARVLTILGPVARAAVPALTMALRDSFPPLREEAIRALSRIGPPDVVVPTLSALLQGTGDIPIRAAMALEAMRSEATAAVPALTAALQVNEIRWSAARTLAAIGSSADEALPALREAWNDENRDHVRLAIFHAIHAIQPSAAAGLDGLDELGIAVPPPRFSLAGVRASQRRSYDSTINVRIGDLFDGNGDVRATAVNHLEWFMGGLHHERRAPVIVQALAIAAMDEQPRIRAAIVEAVGRARRAGGRLVLTTLMWALRDPNAEVRREAATELRYLESDAGDAIPELLPFAQNDPSPYMRGAALTTIAHILGGTPLALFLGRTQETEARHTHGQIALPVLTAAVTDPDSIVRQQALQGLLGVDRDLGIRTLSEMAQSPNERLRVSAVVTIREFDPAKIPEAIPILHRSLDDDNVTVRTTAAYALGIAHAHWKGQRPPDQSVLVSLIGRLDDESTSVRRAVAWALKDFGPAAAPAVPALIEALQDPDADTRGRAASALGAVGVPAARAVPALIEALQDSEVRRSAAGALGRIGPAAAPAVPALIQTLEDERDDIRHDAAVALGRIGPAAAAAEDALRTLARRDPSAHVRNGAFEALSRILP